MTGLTPTRQAAVDWAREAALPFWLTRGWDERLGGFYERLNETGEPDIAAPRRARVQARQIYVFAHAALLGWSDAARSRAESGFAWWLDHCRPPAGGPGFIHIVGPEGAPLDTRIDAYDQAFGLMALAWMYRLTGDAQIRVMIDAEIDFLDSRFADRRTGGWREAIPDATPRRQNPHMHAFEAMLCLHEATGGRAFLDRAAVFLDLLKTRFLDRDTGVLREYFDTDLKPLDSLRHDIAEPGHHFEWTWLLHSYARLAGQAPEPVALKLYHWALRHGLDGGGFAVDDVAISGAPRTSSRRLWPQTELVKAHLALAEAGLDDEAATRADAALDRLMKAYFTERPRGGWVDRYDGAGTLMDGRMWASSFYHIFRAITEAARTP